MGKVISLANHKGGVGKTTSTANIGKALANLGKKVLLIDTDAQANLSAFFLDPNAQEHTIYDAFVSDMPLEQILVNVDKKLDLVPSSIKLSAAEYMVASRTLRELILSKLIKPLRNKYDFILIDCPPSLGVITSNDFVASDYVYIPLVGETLPMYGLTMLHNIVESLSKDINPDLCVAGIFMTRYSNRTLHHSVEQSVKEAFPNLCMETKIRECIALAEAPAANKTIFDYAPDSNGADDYLNLAKEIIKRSK